MIFLILFSITVWMPHAGRRLSQQEGRKRPTLHPTDQVHRQEPIE